MNDSELYLAVHKALKSYFHASLKTDWDSAYQATNDLVDLSQQLQDVTCEQAKKVAKPKTKRKENVDQAESSGDSSSVNGGSPETT